MEDADVVIKRITESIKNMPPPSKEHWEFLKTPWLCPDRATHRGPEGPNEDIGTCYRCNSFSYSKRPPGVTFGEHRPDCSLPVNHGSYCVGGGSGHPPSREVRG